MTVTLLLFIWYAIYIVESKKILLMSLKPMINDAEIQRHHDAKLCTDFTRCVVGKGKSKTVAFEYTDIDTESLISADEYEKRW